jgi:hypothetical protein
MGALGFSSYSKTTNTNTESEESEESEELEQGPTNLQQAMDNVTKDDNGVTDDGESEFK